MTFLTLVPDAVARSTWPEAAPAWPDARQPAPGVPVLRLREVGVGDATVDLRAYGGEIVQLSGGSATARLRLLALAAGHDVRASGHCEILGRDLATLDPAQRRDLRERHVARVFAADRLPAAATVQACVAMPLVRAGMSVQQARDRAGLELDALGVGALAECRPQALEAAEHRLVLLACALARRPRLLVLEQPEIQLAPAAVAALRLALWALSSTFETCVVMSSAHPRLLASADRQFDLDRCAGARRSGW